MARIKIQGWDVEVGAEVTVRIDRTNIRNLDVSWKKAEKYAELIKKGSEYPPVILEEDPKFPGFYNIIDGAHRIKALSSHLIGVNEVRATLVIKHY